MIDSEFYLTLYQTLSDFTRIRILSLMLRFERVCTVDLEWVLDITQAKSSRHLRAIDHTRIVNRKRVDNWVFYSFKEPQKQIVEQLMKPFMEDPTLVTDAETYRIMLVNRELAASRLYLKSLEVGK